MKTPEQIDAINCDILIEFEGDGLALAEEVRKLRQALAEAKRVKPYINRATEKQYNRIMEQLADTTLFNERVDVENCKQVIVAAYMMGLTDGEVNAHKRQVEL